MTTTMLDHDSFAALSVHERDLLLVEAARRLPFKARVIKWITNDAHRTYAVVEIHKPRLYGDDRIEYASYLVAFSDDRPYFDSGWYRDHQDTALDEMFARAGI